MLLLEKFVLILNEVKSRRAIKKLDCTFGSLLLYLCLTLTNKNVQKITCFSIMLLMDMTCSIMYLLLMEMPLPLLEHPGLMIHKFRRPSISICAGHTFLSFSKVFLAWKRINIEKDNYIFYSYFILYEYKLIILVSHN